MKSAAQQEGLDGRPPVLLTVCHRTRHRLRRPSSNYLTIQPLPKTGQIYYLTIQPLPDGQASRDAALGGALSDLQQRPASQL